MLPTSALYFARRVLNPGSRVRVAKCLCWCGAADDASEIDIDGHDGSIGTISD